MKINNVNLVSFKGKIIDSHAHVGTWQGGNYQVEKLDNFTKQPLSNGDTIEKIIVSNLSCIDQNAMKNELDGNIDMLNIANNNPKVSPLAVCQPKTGSVENIKKIFEEYPNKFIGLKFHPDGHEIMANDSRFEPYLKFAQKKNLPCLFHCGIAWKDGQLVEEAKQFSHPEKIYEMAQKVPETPVILAHLGAGGEVVHAKAIKVLLDSIEKENSTLYADISWVDIDNEAKPTIVELIKKLKNTSKGDMTGRLLFGSDAPVGEFATGKNGLSGVQFYDKTVVDVKNAIKNNFGDEAEEIVDKIFYKNADELFYKKTWAKPNIEETVSGKMSKTKIGLIIGAVALATGSILALILKNKNNQPKTVLKGPASNGKLA